MTDAGTYFYKRVLLLTCDLHRSAKGSFIQFMKIVDSRLKIPISDSLDVNEKYIGYS